ncbi:hypothetical protein GYH30_018588 [Glycine max]|nr:hypothetical protein GYH30_018588 [Glycine max]
MLMVRRTPSYSLVTFYVRRSIAQFRNLTSETKNGDHEHPTKALDAKDCNFVYEICRITRTKPRWEDTLLSQYPSFNFKDPSFFLLYLKHQNNAFLSLRFFHWLCSSCGFSPDQSSCNVLFQVLVDAGAGKLAKSLLDSPGFTPEPASLEGYIQCLSGAGMVEDAVDMLKRVVFCPSVATWNASLLGCLRARRTDLVWTLYEQMMESGVVASINVETVGYLIMVFCAEYKVLKGYELLKELLENGLCPDNVVFNELIRGFCKEGQYDRVSEILHIMIAKQCNPDVSTYQEIIYGLLKMKNSEGFQVFNDLKDRGYFPDRVMYTTVIKGLCEMQRLGEARKLWFEMIKKGFQPNEYTYNVMMHGYCKIGDLAEARKIFEDMRDRGYAETTVSYGTMISGLCLHGRTDEAQSLFEEMFQKGIVPDLITYNCLIKALCKEVKIVKARKLLNLLLAQGLELSVFSFSPLIKQLCIVGNTKGAITLWKDMHDRLLEPTASIFGIEWLLNMLSWKQKPQKQTFEYLINSLSQENRLDDILVVLDFMFRIGYILEKGTIYSLVSKFSRDNFHFPDLCLEKILERN